MKASKKRVFWKARKPKKKILNSDEKKKDVPTLTGKSTKPTFSPENILKIRSKRFLFKDGRAQIELQKGIFRFGPCFS